MQLFFYSYAPHRDPHSFPTRRSSDLRRPSETSGSACRPVYPNQWIWAQGKREIGIDGRRSEEHTSELQSHHDLVCRLLLEKKNTTSCFLTPCCSTSTRTYI